MRTTEKSETYSISKIEYADLKYYLNNVRNALSNIGKNNNNEIGTINVGVGIYNIEKALEILK